MSETQHQLYATQSALAQVSHYAYLAHREVRDLRAEIETLKVAIRFDRSGKTRFQDFLDAESIAASKDEASIYKALNPADLPSDELLTYNQIVHLMGPDPLRRATVEKYALNEGYEKRFPRGFRRSPKTAVVWRAGDIAQFFNCKPSTEVAQ